LTKNGTVGVRLTWGLSRGRTSLILPPGAENPSYATAGGEGLAVPPQEPHPLSALASGYCPAGLGCPLPISPPLLVAKLRQLLVVVVNNSVHMSSN